MKNDKRTREQRKADASARMAGICFLGLLFACIAYMVVNAG